MCLICFGKVARPQNLPYFFVAPLASLGSRLNSQIYKLDGWDWISYTTTTTRAPAVLTNLNLE